MEIRQFDPAADDATEDLRAYTAILNASRAADAPWRPRATPWQVRGELAYGWDLEPEVPFLALEDGEAVGCAAYGASEYDNLHLASLDLLVHPDHRRRGLGTELFDRMCEVIRGIGRRSLYVGGWDSDQTRGFAAHRDLPQRSVAVNRRQVLGDIDPAEIDRLGKEAAERAAAYELIRRAGPSPEGDLADLAEVTAAINDAPTDDLDVEDEVYSAERVRAFETARDKCGERYYRVLARHRETGSLAGHTVISVHPDNPAHGEQLDTAVVPAHRGHRLGLLLKADMVQWLRDEEPQLEHIDTWNAESNDHMISVNEALGYRILGRSLGFQRDI